MVTYNASSALTPRGQEPHEVALHVRICAGAERAILPRLHLWGASMAKNYCQCAGECHVDQGRFKSLLIEAIDCLYTVIDDPILNRPCSQFIVDSQTGPLQNPSNNPKARVLYSANYPDSVGRTQATANYGTNGGTSLSRPDTIPRRSDVILVSSMSYDAAGNLLETGAF